MIRWIVLAMMVLLTFSSTGLCIDWDEIVCDTNRSGEFWIVGAQHKNHWGYVSGGGIYRPLLGDHTVLVIPATFQVGADSEHAEAMLNFSPHVGYSFWRLVLTASPGYTNLWEKKRYTGSFKFEGSLSFVIDREYKFKKLKDGRLKGELHQIAVTAAIQYWPGSRTHAAIVGFSFFQ